MTIVFVNPSAALLSVTRAFRSRARGSVAVMVADATRLSQWEARELQIQPLQTSGVPQPFARRASFASATNSATAPEGSAGGGASVAALVEQTFESGETLQTTAYDRGSAEFYPAENNFAVSVAEDGTVVTGTNVVAVRPNAPVAGYTAGGPAAGLTHAAGAATTVFLSVPMPSISTSTTSPGFRNTCGDMAKPTPAGVPVEITSPGWSVITDEMYETIFATSKMRYFVFDRCRTSPFTRHSIERPPPFPSSSAVTIQGPIGAKLSCDFTRSHWLSLIWKLRAETSSRTV